MRFFFDRCAPIAIARMAHAVEGARQTIIHHDEDNRFPPETTDIEWMRELHKDGNPPWIVISGDGRILRNKAERKVLEEVGLPFFCFDKTWPNLEIYEYSWKFMKVWPKIVDIAASATGRLYRVRAGASLAIEII
jgi:PIN like domain